MSLHNFHPAVAAWFEQTFKTPTAPQLAAWPAIQSGEHALIAAPTGSGKTLAAFLAAIDSLVRQALVGQLADAIQVVYVSPLKALSNDVQRNLEQPLAGIEKELEKLGRLRLGIRTQVRTGDTPQSERAAMRKLPPHILVTTPESLYLLLTSESGRQMLSTTRTVIVDEIHAVAATKRGVHLSLSLERLASLCAQPLQRIGLSATQKPIEDVARFLVGSGKATATQQSLLSVVPCHIVNTGHVRDRDLALVLPDAPLEAVMSSEVWENIYDKLAALISTHHTTLVFCNTRRLVERVTRHLSERLGAQNVAAHHGSLAKEQRLDAEQRLKQGKLQALVATASLELGIDIGDVELVCQLSSPRAIATFLQRVGRANHAVGGVPKGRLFPLSRDDLIECTALLQAVRAGELDRLNFQTKPLDVLSQQIVAEVSSQEYGEDELYSLVTRAWPYRDLQRKEFDEIVRMLSDGFATRRGRQSAYLHRDAVNSRLRARRGARLTAIMCGGAIPDNADYHVILEPAAIMVGTLNEDFAIESNAGDIFQLGNASYRVLRVEAGRMRVEDAHGQPPTIPFWLGEAPARTAELSQAVGRLRAEIASKLATIDSDSLAGAIEHLMQAHGLEHVAAEQIVEYLGAAKAVLEQLPTQDTIVLERFFDETGGMQLVVHAPFGGRINRAFGLSLRKRFCRSFNFELQAAATEDAIILSLGETHSFPLEDVARFLHSNSVRDVLIQALLDAPMFATRWRWSASIALAIQRMRAGKRTPAAIQRIASEDLISVVFPDQLACQENIKGEREIPDHPLVRQTINDCLHEAMDIDGLITVLTRIESNAIKVVAKDLPQPSPLAQEILNARPYAFLDDAPLEERRTQAVAARRWLDPQSAAQFGQLDSKAIQLVRDEAWPNAESADELHDALVSMGLLMQTEGELSHWQIFFEQLVALRRATRFTVCHSNGETHCWVAAELLAVARAIYPGNRIQPNIEVPSEYQRTWESDAALIEIVRGRLQAMGPTTITQLSEVLMQPAAGIEAALLALEVEGFVLRGKFDPQATDTEWCERRLLARIHRYTLQSLRAEIEPVSAADCMRFLLDWQGVTRTERAEGVQALASIVDQLEGFEVPAAAWEADVLAARTHEFDPNWLDSLCLSGRALWARLTPPKAATSSPVRATPISIVTRKHWPLWQRLTGAQESLQLSASAQAMQEFLQAHGASFFDDIASGTRLLPSQAEAGLAELVASGLVTSDSFSGLRALLIPQDKKRRMAARGRRIALFGLEDAGRWSLVHRQADSAAPVDAAAVETIAWVLLRRYGVLFRRLLEREADWLPPWHILVRALRRLEAQGHIRGGRFVAGLPGEQYALPDAVAALRTTRRRPPSEKMISLSAADPLNLVGTLLPGPRVPALTGNRILLRDGVALAVYSGGETQMLAALEPQVEWAARNALLHKRMTPGTAGLHSPNPDLNESTSAPDSTSLM